MRRYGLTIALLWLLLVSWAQEAYVSGVVYHDRNRNGIRDPGEPGVRGVLVSNQREVVRTDSKGRYRLPVEDDTIIFVVKPRGWMTALDSDKVPRFYYVHKPNGSPPVAYLGVAPTGPLPESLDFPLYPQRESNRFTILVFGDTQPRDLKEVAYIAHDVLRELVGTREAVLGIVLGDVVFDDLSVTQPLARAIGRIGIPFYYVLGNHDMNYDSPDDRYSDETWERLFGPNYYAFQHGHVHFLVLDDVVWEGAREGRRGRYQAGLGEKQLTFIRNYLQHVPRRDWIVLCMHIPMWEWAEQERRALFEMLAPFSHTLSFSAHTHYQTQRFFGDTDGWQGREAHLHWNAVTVCGSWWTGAPDPLGIPHTTMRDGTPNGYLWVSFDRDRYRIRYQASRRPPDYQMNIYLPNAIPQDQLAATKVLVNVFAGSERSIVEMRVNDEGDWIRLERVPDQPDPAYAELKRLEQEYKLPGRPLPGAMPCPHLWSGQLPSWLPRGTHVLYVRTTDMFGQTFVDKRLFRVE